MMRAAARTGQDESAVSAVVGAVLVFALFSTAMTIYAVTTLPDWKADKEQAHQDAVQQAFGGLQADLDALAVRRDVAPVTASIPLEVPQVPLLQSTPARGRLGIADGFAASFAFPAVPSLFAGDGAAVAAPTTPFTTPPCTGLCVEAVQALTLGFATRNVNSQSVAVTLTVTDSAATPATLVATLSHLGVGTNCPVSEIRLAVNGVVQPILCTGKDIGDPDPLRLDLLDSPLFTSALSRLTTPLQFAFSTSVSGPGTLEATSGYTMVFEDASGLLRVTGTGVPAPAPVPAVDGRRLVFTPSYQSFPSQDLSFEGGAVLVDAGDRSQAMATEPTFAMTVTNGVGSLSWTLVELSGDGGVGGAKDAKVTLTYRSSQDVVLLTPTACNPCSTITLTTPTAYGWGNFLALATLAAGSGPSATATTGTAASSLSLASGTGLPVTGGWVLHLRIVQAEVVVA